MNWFYYQSKFSLKNAAAYLVNFLLALSFVAALFFVIFRGQLYDWSSIWEYKALFINGFFTTVWISAISLILSCLIGLIAAFARRSKILFIRSLGLIYIETVRGTPLLVQILFFFYVVAHAIGLENRYAVGVLTLAVFSGAYIAEMIRGGIDTIQKSQLDSAKAIGLTKMQTYRFIIFPQAIRQILPSLAGQSASIIKDSSLLSIIGISELTNSAQQVNSATYSTLESFFPLAIGYLALTLPISIFSKALEKRFQYEN